MNQTQASSLLRLGFPYVARYDMQGQRVAAWTSGVANVALHQLAGDRAVQVAQARVAQASPWGSTTGDRLARQITTDAITGLLTFLVPVPGGGVVVATLEQWVFNEAATALADKLEAAVEQEFGPQLAPYIAAGIGVGVLVLVAIAASKS